MAFLPSTKASSLQAIPFQMQNCYLQQFSKLDKEIPKCFSELYSSFFRNVFFKDLHIPGVTFFPFYDSTMLLESKGLSQTDQKKILLQKKKKRQAEIK